MKLLIVEDNERIRQTIRSIVEDITDECFECADGSEALGMYERHHPDWVLMDLRMSKMDGIEATRQIKSSYPHANIVIVTDYDDVELRKVASRAGACDYVVKRELFDLRTILSRPHLA